MDFQKKQAKLLNDLVETYKKAIEDTKKKIGEVDEKYRKLAEKESAALKKALADYEKQSKVFEAMIPTLQGEDNSVEETVETEPAEDEKVVDDIFPENNEAPVEGPAVEEPVVESEPTVQDMADEVFGKSDDAQPEEPVKEESKSNDDFSDIWPEANTASEPATVDTEDGWPEVPEDWN